MKIILISGKAQHGKDTLAEILQKHFENNGVRVLRIAFADYVKYVCSQYYQWDGEKDEAGRHLLQHVGTEQIRSRDENFWVDTVIRFVQVTWGDYDYAIITDCRFPNEINRWAEFGIRDVITVRVERIGFESGLTPEQKLHPSEVSLDGHQFDYHLAAVDIADLEEKCVDLYITIKNL